MNLMFVSISSLTSDTYVLPIQLSIMQQARAGANYHTMIDAKYLDSEQIISYLYLLSMNDFHYYTAFGILLHSTLHNHYVVILIWYCIKNQVLNCIFVSVSYNLLHSFINFLICCAKILTSENSLKPSMLFVWFYNGLMYYLQTPASSPNLLHHM